MTLTKPFGEVVRARAAQDVAFREAMLAEGIEALIAGDLETGKEILRTYVDATVGFAALAAATGTPERSLVRMLGPRGNPSARTLFTVIGQLQRIVGIDLRVSVAH